MKSQRKQLILQKQGKKQLKHRDYVYGRINKFDREEIEFHH